MNVTNPKTILLKNYRPTDFSIETIHLHFDLFETYTRVISILKIKRNPLANAENTPLVLMGEEMSLQRILLNNRELNSNEYEVTDTTLTLFQVPEHFTLETEVVIKPQENTSLTGLYQSRQNFCTQCEAQGFRRITYYLDRPDVMARFTTTISADKNKYPFLLSNGNLMEKRELSNGRHWVRWEDPSLKPSYLFALVAGDFDLLMDEYVTLSGRKVSLHLYLEKGFADQGAYALVALKKAMQWDENTYGREYDLDIYMIVAVSDFNMGAMENKGLNVFNTKYILAKPETATDEDYIAIESVIGHEYFHNWTGNRITCRDWFQITLKEGLTVFRDQHFTEDMTSYEMARLDNINIVRNHQFVEDAGPTAHPIRPDSYIEVNNFYTTTVYRKGAEVIRMIRTLIGNEMFHKGMDLYFKRFDGHAVTTEDFVKAMEDASGKDLAQFKRWYSQAGTPILKISSEYSPSQKKLTLTVKQSCPPTPQQAIKKPLHFPLQVGLVGSNCEDLPSSSKTLEIAEAEQTFTFENINEKPIPSLLRNFSAPVKIEYDYTDEELLWLWRCDSNFFTRWNAGQEFSQRLIFNLIKNYRAGQSLQIDARLIELFEHTLKNDKLNLCYLSRLLQLPTETYLLHQMKIADVEGIYVARQFLKKEIAIALQALLQKLYKQHQVKKYHFDMENVGKRNLKNFCLKMLTETELDIHYQLAMNQLEQSDNMTDTMGALLALNNHACVEREKALSQFYEDWKNQPLVVNKWLRLNGISTLATTLENVKGCLSHRGFDMNNPNNVYSLIGSFGANALRFHEVSGEGYIFLKDQILKLDPMNPQVAVRMVMPLTQWQQFDKNRQQLMKDQLQEILKIPKLSRDMYEIVSKSLPNYD